MNPLHLLWIIPLSGGVGVFIMAIFAGGRSEEPEGYDVSGLLEVPDFWPSHLKKE